MFVTGYHFPWEVKSLWVHEVGSSLRAWLDSHWALAVSAISKAMLTAALPASFLSCCYSMNSTECKKYIFLALVVAPMVLLPMGWCRKHGRLLTDASRPRSHLILASTAACPQKTFFWNSLCPPPSPYCSLLMLDLHFEACFPKLVSTSIATGGSSSSWRQL